MNVNLHIERLVIDGKNWQPAQRAQFETAFTTELSRLLKSCGVSGERAGVAGGPEVPAATASIGRDTPPSIAGAHIARAVFQRIGNAPCDE